MTRPVDPRDFAPRAPVRADAPRRSADWLDLLRAEAHAMPAWNLDRLLDRWEQDR